MGTPADEVRRRAINRERRYKQVIRLCQLLAAAVVLAVWEFGPSQAELLGSPSAIVPVLLDWITERERWHDLSITLQEALVGYVIGTVAGIVMASAVSASQLVFRVISPLVAALNALPKLALAPLFILIFGLGMQSKIFFVVTAVFFLSFWNISSGIRAIDPIYSQNARALGASRYWLLRDVYTPAALGSVLASLRLSLSWALVAAVTSEYLGSFEGLGNVIARAQSTFEQDEVVAGLIVVAVIAVVFDRVLINIERRFSKWRA